MTQADEHLLEVEHLRVSFHTYAGEVKAVRDVSFFLDEGETLAFVGESGCGKSVTSKALMRLLKPPVARIDEGSRISFCGEDVLRMDKKRLRALRGAEISMIFQDPMTSLNPTMTCGKQIMETLMLHRGMDKAAARKEAIRMLETVRIPDAEKRVDQYPHQMSGGMRQRVMIAIALACNPKILIADEPTTALDVTIQAQILELLQNLREELHTAVILVTHDLGVVANFADRIQVMYAGQIVERGTVREIFREAKHPYTWALLRSVPKLAKETKQELYTLKGTPPDLILPLAHCPFAARCEYCMPICRERMPEETSLSGTHGVCCHLQHPMAPKVEGFTTMQGGSAGG
ncbi:MAG: ABC transporter ATP-binding protein [Lachnospiraceae bacterium]|nr:ABC transporter ATP-binding protein [Lachnospiraceae bacterium]